VIGRAWLASLALLAAAHPSARAADEPPPGAASCSGCHSATVATAIPRIAGREEKELLDRMEAFRSGQQPSTVMVRLMKGFTPSEMRAIAGYWAAQK